MLCICVYLGKSKKMFGLVCYLPNPLDSPPNFLGGFKFKGPHFLSKTLKMILPTSIIYTQVDTLPCTMKSLIREDASDRVAPHPTARMIKHLSLVYQGEVLGPVYHPRRLLAIPQPTTPPATKRPTMIVPSIAVA